MSLPTFYYSTDASAPVLTGQTGTLVALLDACLVNGYGTKAAAGWAKSFSAAGKAVYRQGGGSGMYLNVQDGGPGAGTFKEARAWAYETATAQDTGTGQFPTSVQLAAGIIIRKSATLDATARQWILVADDRTFYLFVQTGDSAGVYLAFGFGGFYSLLAGDAFRTFICGRNVENSAVLTVECLDLIQGGGINSTAMPGHYIARGYAGTGGAVQNAKRGDGNVLNNGSNSGMRGALPYVNPTDGGIYVARVYISDPTSSGSVRGYMRGFWHFCHSANSVVDGDQFTGAPGSILAGRTFQIVKNSGNQGVFCIETTNWDTSS